MQAKNETIADAEPIKAANSESRRSFNDLLQTIHIQSSFKHFLERININLNKSNKIFNKNVSRNRFYPILIECAETFSFGSFLHFARSIEHISYL